MSRRETERGEKLNRPYFETKVVKIKREKKKYPDPTEITIDGKKYRLYEDKEGNVYPHKEKGNFVNGENLDKIKFPCFCRWGSDPKMKNWIGMIQKNFWQGEIRYSLERVDIQTEESLTYGVSNNLRDLIVDKKVHILKGKIIIFEEEVK